MDIIADQCRLEGCRDEQASYWTKATHLPTGIQVEVPIAGSIGLEGKRRLMKALQNAVNRHLNDQLAKL